MASRCENKNYTDANILHLISRLFKIFFTVPTEDSYKKCTSLQQHTSSITPLAITMWEIKGEIEYNKATRKMSINKKWKSSNEPYLPRIHFRSFWKI